MWKLLRIAVLLLILFVVAAGTLIDRWRTTDWTDSLWVAVFPVNADGSEVAARYIADLSAENFADVEAFFAREARRRSVALDQPVHVDLRPQLTVRPPQLPAGAGALKTAFWSLKLRWFAWRNSGDTPAEVRLFALYHDPEQSPSVPHSLGLQKGLVGVVYAFADHSVNGGNSIVIAHELLHTLGATDKYDPATTLPLHPQGFAEPELTPLYPQSQAEIMAGRRALSESEAEMPDSLKDVVVGPATATEIGWTPH